MIPPKIRRGAQCRLFALSRYAPASKIRNQCLITNRGNGVYRSFRLARGKIQELGGAGAFPGVRRAAW